MLLVATAMAVLLAGCVSSQREDQGISKQTPEPTTDERVVGPCADSSGTGGQQEEAGRGDISNGKIVFTRASDIYVVDEEGAHETNLTSTKQWEQDPVWSPDGQKIAYLTTGPSGLGILNVINADGTNRIRLPEGNLAGVVQLGSGTLAWSPDGQKIVFVKIYSGDLYVINADGTNQARLTTLFSGYSEPTTGLDSPAWSPDCKRIAFARGTASDTSTVDSSASASAPAEELTGIYLINVDGTGLRKLTSLSEVQESGGPVWSPDGRKIAYLTTSPKGFGILNVINADGSGRRSLTNPPEVSHVASPTWSPDGKRIAFIDASSELNVINADGSGRRSRINPPGVSHVASPTWSPDSEKLAFSCPFSGAQPRRRSDLCVINADGTGLKSIATKVTSEGISWGR